MIIAIVTGATGGLGKEFIKNLLKEDLNEIWAVGRNEEKLNSLKDLSNKIRPIVCDLSNINELDKINSLLDLEKPNIRYLINNAGMAKMSNFDTISFKEISDTLDVNCKASTILMNYAIPYMSKKDMILNISSASSFQPTPKIALYGATKAFLRSYSRAVNQELKPKGIRVCAVCPGWIDTDMLMKETLDGKKIKFPGLVSANQVVKKALKDAKRGKDMSVCSLFVKYEHLISKLWPHKLIMKIWLKSLSKYKIPNE